VNDVVFVESVMFILTSYVDTGYASPPLARSNLLQIATWAAEPSRTA
jgi:hypothetical protein